MDVKVPDLGVDSAEVAEILVEVGDKIAKDDNIVLLESDKASVEVPSNIGGNIIAINVSVGDNVSEGDVLIELETDETDSNKDNNDGDGDSEDNNDQPQTQKDNQPQQSKTDEAQGDEDDSKQAVLEDGDDLVQQTYTLPDLGVDQADVAEVMVAKGDKVETEQALILVESDKASVEVPAPVAGEIIEVLVNNGDAVSTGQDYIIIASKKGSSKNNESNNKKGANKESESKNSQDSGKDKQSTIAKDNSQSSSKRSNTNQSTTNKLTEAEVNKKLTEVYAGPAVRKLARQLGVDITQIEGSAINGRIVKEDLFDYVKTQMSQNNQSSTVNNTQGTGVSGLPNLPDMTKTEVWGELETQELTRLQKVSIPQLTYNTYLPQVTQFDLADITDTESLRGELKGNYKKQGIGLTILAFVVKATAYALTQHARFNSHLSDDNTQLIVRKTVNMGIAVATDEGLIVPVIKNAQDKGIKQIAIEIGELADKARDKKLTTTELQGASFTISSQGNLGGTYFTPLVNWPQVAILGVSEASMQPRWNEDKQGFEPRLMLPLSLSYDHRVINGADAAMFTRYVATLLSDPRRILL